MTNVKISGLPAGTAPAGTELIPGDQSGVTVSFTPNQIHTLGPSVGPNGGGLNQSGSSNFTLTSTSQRFQNIELSPSLDNTVTLPDATTMLDTGGPNFIISNWGWSAFAILNNAGQPKAIVGPDETVMVFLSDNSTAAGVWYIGSASGIAGGCHLTRGHARSAISGTPTGISITSLSATQALVLYNTGGNMAANVVTVSPGSYSISVGSTQTLGSPGSGAITSVVAINSTTAMVVYSNKSSYLKAMVLSISGNTVTANTPITIVSANIPYCQVFMISSTSFYVGYSNSGRVLYGVVLSLSGTTITANSIATGATSGTGALTSAAVTTGAMLSPTSFVFVLQDATAQAFSVSGTTVTFGSPTSVGTASIAAFGAGPGQGIVGLSSSSALVMIGGYNTAVFGIITVSGTTITVAGSSLLGQDINIAYSEFDGGAQLWAGPMILQPSSNTVIMVAQMDATAQGISAINSSTLVYTLYVDQINNRVKIIDINDIGFQSSIASTSVINIGYPMLANMSPGQTLLVSSSDNGVTAGVQILDVVY